MVSIRLLYISVGLVLGLVPRVAHAVVTFSASVDWPEGSGYAAVLHVDDIEDDGAAPKDLGARGFYCVLSYQGDTLLRSKSYSLSAGSFPPSGSFEGITAGFDPAANRYSVTVCLQGYESGQWRCQGEDNILHAGLTDLWVVPYSQPCLEAVPTLSWKGGVVFVLLLTGGALYVMREHRWRRRG